MNVVPVVEQKTGRFIPPPNAPLFGGGLLAQADKSAHESRYRLRLPDGSVRHFLEKGQAIINAQHLDGVMIAVILPLSA